jgi:hypothetical protein
MAGLGKMESLTDCFEGEFEECFGHFLFFLFPFSSSSPGLGLWLMVDLSGEGESERIRVEGLLPYCEVLVGKPFRVGEKREGSLVVWKKKSKVRECVAKTIECSTDSVQNLVDDRLRAFTNVSNTRWIGVYLKFRFCLWSYKNSARALPPSKSTMVVQTGGRYI